MQNAIIYLDPGSAMNLQNQIRQKLVEGILNGAFAPGMKLPSSRKLAQQLDVARNTVVAAYHALIADGYLVSRQRSGIFVNEEILATRVGHSGEGSIAAQAEGKAWARRVKSLPARWREVHDQPNWRHYPYLECDKPVWVVVLSGLGGIIVAVMPNDTVHYYFSDGNVHRYLHAIRESHRIRPMCEVDLPETVQ